MPWTDPVAMTGDADALLSNSDRTISAQRDGSSSEYTATALGTRQRLQSDGGKWYFEVKIDAQGGGGLEKWRRIGVKDTVNDNLTVYTFQSADVGDVFGVAADLDAEELVVYLNDVDASGTLSLDGTASNLWAPYFKSERESS